MRKVVIASAVRTPMGKFGKALRDIPAPRLGAYVVKEAVKRAGIGLGDVDEVIMGNVISAGLGQNPARQAAIYAGIPVDVGAFTVNKVCGSGLKAVALAAQAIMVDEADIVVAGGMENMSQAPHLLRGLRWGVRYGDSSLVDAMVFDGLWDIYNGFHMIATGEIIAEKYGVTRREADEFALESHRRAVKATREGRFKGEILPLELSNEKGGKVLFERDEGPREDTSMEKLAQLKPVIKEDGIITPGNASQLSDGAAALVVMAEEKASELGVDPLARILGFTNAGVDPKYVMEAPIPAVRKLLNKTGLSIEDVDLVEHNEAFAPASIVVSRVFRISSEAFNVNGGAVALGHPIGCSGARILTTLLYALKDRDLHRGIATLCLGGGNAVAMMVER